ncbi:MAG: S49 family peptidase [Fibromonadales bacterium]|nr:S49 family peptidase [Fibromonadales bacterium]
MKFSEVYFGGYVYPRSMDELEWELQNAAQSDSDAIILLMRSPGGYTYKVPEIGRLIEKIEKPVIAYTDTFAFSAAYWLIAACDAIYAAPSAEVGSVGVYAETFDYQKYFDDKYIDHKVLRSGDRKARTLDGQMDEQEIKEIQASVDKIHAQFIEHVQRHRNINKDFLQGQTYDSAEALEKGFIDGLADSLNDLENFISSQTLNQGGTMKNIFSFFNPKSPKLLATEGAPEAEAQVGGMQVSTSAQPAQPATQPNLTAKITKVVYAGQEKLAMELLASGKSEVEILEALYDDLKNRKAAEPVVAAPTKDELAAQVLKELREGTPSAPNTNEQTEPNVYEQYKAIENPTERQAFLKKHQAEIERLSTQSKKEDQSCQLHS